MVRFPSVEAFPLDPQKAFLLYFNSYYHSKEALYDEPGRSKGAGNTKGFRAHLHNSVPGFHPEEGL